MSCPESRASQQSAGKRTLPFAEALPTSINLRLGLEGSDYGFGVQWKYNGMGVQSPESSGCWKSSYYLAAKGDRCMDCHRVTLSELNLFSFLTALINWKYRLQVTRNCSGKQGSCFDFTIVAKGNKLDWVLLLFFSSKGRGIGQKSVYDLGWK